MCTLTYLPLGNEQFIISTNRDESPLRAKTEFPFYRQHPGKNIIYPKDPLAGGTWIATTDNGVSVCLLNGANEPHDHNPPYKMSRGIMLLEAIECIKPDEFFKNFNFEGIEPFTMVVLFHDPQLIILEFKWDGAKKYLKKINPAKPQIWASAQLYNETAIINRKKWFKQWLKNNKTFSMASIKDFHKNAGSGDLQNDLIMDRGEVKTVSITQICSMIGSVTMYHESLIESFHQEISLSQHVNQKFSHQVL